MLYDHSSGKGRRCRSLPSPNPQKVDLPRKSTLIDLLSRARELYFGESANLAKMNIADSAGMIIRVDNKLSWILEEYYKGNDYKPSRHKLYVTYDKEEVSMNVSQN